MGQMQENKTKIVSKAIVAIIALSMILPASVLIAGAKETGTPFVLSAPIVDTFYQQNDIVKLANAQFDVKTGPQNMARELAIDKYDDRVNGWYLVKFNDAIDEYWVASLKSMGAKIGNYVPYNTYMVKMDASTMSEVQNLPYVRSVSIYQPAFRVQPSLLQGITLKSGMQSADALQYISWTNLYEQASVMGKKNDVTTVTIMLHEGENPYDLAALIGKAGGKVLGTTDTSIRAEISKEGIQALAFINDVEYIMPYFANEIMLADTGWTEQSKVTGSYPVWDKALRGENITIGIADTGLNTDHDHFRQNGYTPSDWTGSSPTHRKVVGYHQLGDNKVDYFGAGDDPGSGHGSHVTGIATGNAQYVGGGGQGTNGWGMAPNAKVSFCDIGKSDDGTGLNDLTLGGIPQDLKTMYALQKGDGASLSSNSWGVSVAYDSDQDGTDDARTYSEGTYSEDSLNSDWYMWQNKEFQIFFSNGNDRGLSTYGGPAYNSTTTPPATGKNMVSVGAHSAGTAWATIMSFSSWGPTLDGRLKPDVTATGVEDSASADSTRDGVADTTYVSMQGTSMSSPATLGDAALVAQYFREGWAITGTKVAGNGFVPSNALIKATLINGAKDPNTVLYPYVLNGWSMQYPNGDQGWGAVDTGDSLYFSGDTREVWYEDNKAGLITDQVREYTVSVAAGTPLEITLVWTDFPGTVATWGALVNDLDLTVIGPTGTVYYGNNFGATSRQADSTNPAGYDHTNPVECVLISAPTAGTYKILVDAIAIPKGPQPFGLVAAANFDAGFGWVKTNAMVYKSGDTMTIEVQDTNAASASVTLTSSTGDIETKALTLASTGRWTTTMAVNALTPVSGNGAISIENEGTISVKYTDVSPAHDSYANVTTLLSSPKISNVYVSDISNSAGIIHWTTDVPATSQVFYGTTTALGSSSTLDGDMVLTHDVAITGLTGFTNYYFDVQSVSIGGVTTRDTNGGDHYMFTTVDNPDVLIIQEHSDIESSAQQVRDWELSLGSYGWSFTVWETIKYGLPTLAAMNSAKVCYWDVGEGYPQLGLTERALVQSWVSQAGVQKWYMTGQDVGWDMCDPAGTDINVAWYNSYLHATFVQDDADGGGGTEIVAGFDIAKTTHAISTAFATATQDLEQDIYGATRFWPDAISRAAGADNPSGWAYSSYPVGGDTASIAYTGADFKLAYEAFAHAMIQDDNTFGTAGHIFGTNLDVDRAWIADSTIKWLMGEDHPDVVVLNNNGQAEDGTWSGTRSITWTVANAASQQVQISKDGGQSYVVEASLSGVATTYSWDTTTETGGLDDYPNGENYKIKILAQGTTLKAFDVSDAVFTIDNGATGDEIGPVVVAGSIKVNPLPGGQGNTITFEAQGDDRAKGNSDIAGAEIFIDATGTTGTGIAMSCASGTFDTQVEDVIGFWKANVAQGSHIVFIHARDAAGNWGGYQQFSFQINEGGPDVWVSNLNAANTIISGTYAITWVAADYTDLPATLDCVIEYSANGGTSWTVLESALNNNDGTYSWNTALLADGTNYKVRVTATDSYPLTGTDMNNATFSIDNIVNDRWYLQVQPDGSNYALNMMPVDLGPNSKSSAGIGATGQHLIGTWQTGAITGVNIAGPWTFNIYGAVSGTASTGYLYAKVFKASDLVTPLDTTILDDENVFLYTAPHLFTWTDTLAGTFASGEDLVVEVWTSVTALGRVGSGVATYNFLTPGTSTIYYLDANEAPVLTSGAPGGTTQTANAALDASDNNRYTSADPGNGDFVALKSFFNITDAPQEITQIVFTWEGYVSRAATGNEVNLYVYDQTAGSWTFLTGGEVSIVAGTDTTLSYTMTGANWADYVTGASNTLIYLMEYMLADGGNPTTTTMTTDYLSVAVTWNVAPPTMSVYFDYIGAQSYIDPTIGASGMPPYVISLTGKLANSWVFVSFPSAMSGAINTVLNDAAAGDGLTTWTVAKWYNPQTPMDLWKTYRVGSTVNDMPTLTNTMGVWLWITANGGDQGLTLSSYAANPGAAVVINLYTGWNMVGYPTATSRAESATLPAACDLVASWQLASPYITQHAKGATMMVTGNAYWVHVTTDTTWSVAP